MMARLKFKLLIVLCLACVAAMFVLSFYCCDVDTLGDNIPSIYKRSFTLPTTTSKYNATAAMLERIYNIRNICSSSDLRLKAGAGLGYSSIVSLDQKRLTYCPIPKGGWSTWKRLFYRERNVEHLMGNDGGGFQSKWGEAGLQVVNNVKLKYKTKYRLVFVRDPYDRLVSAYKDKVMSDNSSQIRNLKSPFCIIYKYKDPPEPALTFPQFVHCIIVKANVSREAKDNKQAYGAGLNIHWRPQTLLCDFCSMDYNVIGHMEHMDDDVTEALQVLNMTVKTPVKENSSGTNATNKLPLTYWYRQLNYDLMRDVRNLYINDFQLLGYNDTVEWESSASN